MITQNVPGILGMPPTFATPSASDTVDVGAILIVKNASGASITATMVTPNNLPTGDAYPDKAYSVPAAGERWIPILPDYRNGAGVAAVTFSTTASVTAAAISL